MGDTYLHLSQLKYFFLQKHSTLTIILSATDKIQKAIDDSNYACRIVLDLSKASDSVNHEIPIHYGIRAVARDWFGSCLHNRKQFVSLGYASSETLAISCDVPQELTGFSPAAP